MSTVGTGTSDTDDDLYETILRILQLLGPPAVLRILQIPEILRILRKPEVMKAARKLIVALRALNEARWVYIKALQEDLDAWQTGRRRQNQNALNEARRAALDADREALGAGDKFCVVIGEALA